jgi:hypothetical protein
VTIPAGSGPATPFIVEQPWTPTDSGHQCVQVTIDYDLDPNFDNNVTQRNLQVGFEATMTVENPFMAPARFEIQSRANKEDWNALVEGDMEFGFDMDADYVAPRPTRVQCLPSPGISLSGDPAICDFHVYAAPEGRERQLIGGVTLESPTPCRLIGQVVNRDQKPLEDTKLVFREKFTNSQETAVTDKDGVFSLEVIPYVVQELLVAHPDYGEFPVEVTPSCGFGALIIVLGEDGVELSGP